MKVDPRKVNLSEKDVEEYLCEHPEIVSQGLPITVDQWIGRQVTVPSGIIDLLGITDYGHAVVVEIKNVPIEAKALTQVARYAADIESILGLVDPDPNWIVYKIVVGPSCDNQTLREAEAIDVEIQLFELNYDVSVSHLHWTQEYREKCQRQHLELANSPIFAIFHDFADGRYADDENVDSPDTPAVPAIMPETVPF